MARKSYRQHLAASKTPALTCPVTEIGLPIAGMQVEVWVASPEPAVGGSVTPGTCQARL
jgi:hypothetical protein